MESMKSTVNTLTEAVFPGIVYSSQPHLMRTGSEMMTSLPLQMSLFFNAFYSPFWLITHILTLHLKFSVLSKLFQILMIGILILFTVIEIHRLFLGYIGNLSEKVPELAGFWLLTIFLQLPLHTLLLFYEGLYILPLERAVDSVMFCFILFEVIITYVTLRRIAKRQVAKFHFEMQDLSLQTEVMPTSSFHT